ncbi:MAG TPA: DUF6635 family protein [Myxococcota bacterium]|nr:DUF6635 family protein [Myxococcota bacterium]
MKADDGAIERYIEERRQLVDAFVARHFTLAGTVARFRRTFVKDIARYPINFLLSLPSLFVKQVADWLEMAGWDHGARLLERIPLPLKTVAQAEVERAVVEELLELPPGDARLPLLHDPFKSFRGSRLAILDAASSGLTLLLAFIVFGDSGLSPYAMGDKLARAQAKRDAASGFILGSGVGSAFYSVFPPHPTPLQVFGATAVVLLTLGMLGTLTHLFSDPLQQRAGIQRRQLLKLINAFGDKMILHARKGGAVPIVPTTAAAPAPSPPTSTSTEPPRARLRERAAKLIAPLIARYHGIEDRYGRARALQVIIVPLVLGVILTVVLADRLRFDPYREIRELIGDRAYPTAIARLDILARQGVYQKQADYWYWRGRALIGDHSYEAGADAYRSAIQRNPSYRDDDTVIDDLVTAVAKGSNAKAKSLLLTEHGPRAVDKLVDRTVVREKVDRWALVEIAERLGASERLDYEDIALIDLEQTTTCAEKKRTVQKIGEHQVTDVIDELRELQDNPQWKCLEPGLKNVIDGLATR